MNYGISKEFSFLQFNPDIISCTHLKTRLFAKPSLIVAKGRKYGSDVLLWTSAYGRAKAERPARTYIQQLCEDTGCSPEDMPGAMNDRERWREKVRVIRAGGTSWWWWWWGTKWGTNSLTMICICTLLTITPCEYDYVIIPIATTVCLIIKFQIFSPKPVVFHWSLSDKGPPWSPGHI